MKVFLFISAIQLSFISFAHAEDCISSLNSSKEIMRNAVVHESENGTGPILVELGHYHSPDITIFSKAGAYDAGIRPTECKPLPDAATNVYTHLANMITSASYGGSEEVKRVLQICSSYGNNQVKQAALHGLETIATGVTKKPPTVRP